MKIYIITVDNGLYGIRNKELHGVVPNTHIDAKGAIEEMMYYLRLNYSLDRKFLDTEENNYTLEEINKIESDLLQQITNTHENSNNRTSS